MLWIWNWKMQTHPKLKILYIIKHISPWNGIQYWFELMAVEKATVWRGMLLQRSCGCPSLWMNCSNTLIGFSHPYSPRLVWHCIGYQSFSRVPGTTGRAGTRDGATQWCRGAHACPPLQLAWAQSFWIRQKLAVAITEAMSISGIVSN